MDVIVSAETRSAGTRRPCLDEDPEIFFPVGSGPLAQELVAEARVVCSGCSSRVECLERALSTDPCTGRPVGEFGVWGGTTEDERRELLVARRRVAAARRRAARRAGAGVAA